MKSGFSNLIEPEPNIIDTIQPILLSFAEKSVIFAAHYATHAGRNNLSGLDTIYALQFLAHEFLNAESFSSFESQLQLNSDSENSDSDDIMSDSDSQSDSSDEFSRASDENEICKLMNYYHDTWNEWQPTNDIELLLKNNIDKTITNYNISV